MGKEKPPPYFPVIHKDFPAHVAFRRERKMAVSEKVEVGPKQNHSELIGSVDVGTKLLEGSCVFVATHTARKGRSDYGLKLRVEAYGLEPCFRFDSSGASHRNDAGTLVEQKIDTPHFHRVDADGIMRAYRTLELDDPTLCAAIVKDPQAGANLFCQELNLASPDGGRIVLNIYKTELELSAANSLVRAQFPRAT